MASWLFCMQNLSSLNWGGRTFPQALELPLTSVLPGFNPLSFSLNISCTFVSKILDATLDFKLIPISSHYTDFSILAGQVTNSQTLIYSLAIAFLPWHNNSWSVFSRRESLLYGKDTVLLKSLQYFFSNLKFALTDWNFSTEKRTRDMARKWYTGDVDNNMAYDRCYKERHR